MANRALTDDMKTQLEATSNKPIFFFEGVFIGFTLRLWTGSYDITWDSVVWYGNGWFHGIQGLEENNNIESTGMDIILAGVPSDLLSTMLGSIKQGASGKLWLGFLDSDDAVVEDPYMMFDGKLDVPTIEDKVDNPIITISYESELIILNKSKEFRYNTESQKIFNSTDRGFEYVPQIAKGWKGQWGRKPPKPAKKKDSRKNAASRRSGGNRGGSSRK